MKATPLPLVADLGGLTSTPALIVWLKRRDLMVYGYTDHDVSIPFEGVTYRSILALSASNIDGSSALDVDNLEVTGFLSALGITEGDISAGIWDFAEVRISRVNWQDLSKGAEKLKRGWVGQVSQGRDTFTSEVRGLTQKLQQTVGEGYSPSCKANLFDWRCKVVPTEGVWRFPGVLVGIVAEPQRTFASGDLVQETDFFTAGTVTWTSGANVGLSKEIKKFVVGGIVTFQEPMPYPIAPNDEFTIDAGCMKRWQEDCIGKYDNGKNHRGAPFIPGTDVTLRGY